MSGVNVGTAYLEIIPSAKGFASKLSSEMGGDLDKSGRDGGKRFGGGMLESMKAVAGPIAALFAAGQVVDFFKAANEEARESQKVGALTEQVIKSTGGAAKITADQVGELATAISNKTGIDDEAIQSASNLLLTFKNVRNEVGAGNNVFDQATVAATNMGAALGKEPRDAAIMLGKALNDPIAGISALSRTGVQFTDQQKKQIETMVKSGNTLGAQKVILAELDQQFGGAAEAAATAGDKARTAFGNFQEAIGTTFMPVVDAALGIFTSMITKITPLLTPLAGILTSAMAPIPGIMKNVSDAISIAFDGLTGKSETGEFEGIFRTINDGAVGLRETLGPIFAAIGPMLGTLAGPAKSLGDAILPIMQQLGPGLMTAIQPLIPVIGQLVSGLAEAGPEISPLMVALKAITPIIPQLVTTFSALATAVASILSSALASVLPVLMELGGLVTSQLVPALTTLVSAILPPLSALFGVVAEVVGQVLAAVMPLVSTLLAILIPVISQLVTMLAPLIAQLATALVPAFQLVGQIVTVFVGILTAVLIPVIQALMPVVTTVFGVIITVISAALGIVTSIINTVMAALRGDWEGVWKGILSILEGVWNLIKGVVGGAIKIVTTTLAAAWGLIGGTVESAWKAIKDTVGTAIGTVVSTVTAIPGKITAGLGSLTGTLSQKGKDLIQGLISGIGSMVSSVSTKAGQALSAAVGAFGSISSKLSQAGKDLISGFIGGITSMAQSVARTAADVVGSAVTAAKEALGIHSPSRVFMEIGAFTGQGLAAGMAGTTGMVSRAGDALANAAVVDVPSATYGAAQVSTTNEASLLDLLTNGVRVDLDNGRLFFDGHYQRQQQSESLAVRSAG